MLRGVESSPASLCVEKLAWPKARPWIPSLHPSWAPLLGQQNLTDGEGRDCCPLPLPSAPSPFPKKSPSCPLGRTPAGRAPNSLQCLR